MENAELPQTDQFMFPKGRVIWWLSLLKYPTFDMNPKILQKMCTIHFLSHGWK